MPPDARPETEEKPLDNDAKHGTQYTGLFLGLVAGAAWGTTSIGSRYLALRDVFPPLTVFWRFALSLPFMFLAYKLWASGEKRFEWRDLPRITGLAALGVFLMANFGFYATVYTTNINVTIIITASAVLIALLAFFLGARVTRKQWAGVLLGLLGVAFIAFAMEPSDGSEPPLPVWHHALGIGLAVLSSLSWALYTIFGRGMVAKYGGLRTTVWAIAIGAIMQTPVALMSGVLESAQQFTRFEWMVMAYLAVFPTAVAFSLWFVALKYVDVASLGMTQYVGPVISASLGWMLLSEAILWQHVAGTTLIFVALYFASKASASTERKIKNRN